MIPLRGWTLAVALTLSGVSQAQSSQRKDSVARAAKDQLVGAWRLAWLDQPAADGKMQHITDARGSLIYTPDGQVSVQVMFATVDSASANSPVQYAQGGYEASFGRYVVNERTHTVTHRYDGANIRALVGKDLPRLYQFSGGRLIIKSTRSDEHWSVAWER